eukprot:3136856-Pleurochrysis_carterae.AAC.2
MHVGRVVPFALLSAPQLRLSSARVHLGRSPAARGAAHRGGETDRAQGDQAYHLAGASATTASGGCLCGMLCGGPRASENVARGGGGLEGGARGEQPRGRRPHGGGRGDPTSVSAWMGQGSREWVVLQWRVATRRSPSMPGA